MIRSAGRESTHGGNILPSPATAEKSEQMMPQPYGPTTRKDSIPLHANAIRRFREELRMNRPVFADLLEINVDTLRVWEANKSMPRAEAAIKIVRVAKRNDYPMSIADIYPEEKTRKKK